MTCAVWGDCSARQIDPGDLITDDSTARELFHVMRTDILRVFVNVPQVFATGIKVDQKAVVNRREDPAKHFPGKLTRKSDPLVPTTPPQLTMHDAPPPRPQPLPALYLHV